MLYGNCLRIATINKKISDVWVTRKLYAVQRLSILE